VHLDGGSRGELARILPGELGGHLARIDVLDAALERVERHGDDR
jgi:hypothetical protein